MVRICRRVARLLALGVVAPAMVGGALLTSVVFAGPGYAAGSATDSVTGQNVQVAIGNCSEFVTVHANAPTDNPFGATGGISAHLSGGTGCHAGTGGPVLCLDVVHTFPMTAYLGVKVTSRNGAFYQTVSIVDSNPQTVSTEASSDSSPSAADCTRNHTPIQNSTFNVISGSFIIV